MKKGIVANVIKAKKTAIDPIGALSAECNSCAVRFSVPLSATFAESESVYHVDGSHSTDVTALESCVCTMVAACSVVPNNLGTASLWASSVAAFSTFSMPANGFETSGRSPCLIDAKLLATN
jgi:hypothetical protein